MSSSHAEHWRWLRASRSLAGLAGLALLAATAGPAGPVSADTAGSPVTDPFGLIPMATPAGQYRSYFNLTVMPGGSVWDTAIITNEGKQIERLKVTVSKGATATNTATTFVNTTGKCTGTSCWVTGLPHTVTLLPGTRKAMRFRVAVPRQTRPGQYLAGITAQSAVQPGPVRVGSNGHASARAIIIDQVIVGVAVTVGSLARLRTVLKISTVSAGWIGSTPRLYIPVRNAGQTFVRATGEVSCHSGGRPHSYQVVMSTVLPGDSAVVPINARGLSTGPAPCAVRLRDSAGHLVTWSGIVHVPPMIPTKTYHPAKGVFLSMPVRTTPPWAIALTVIGALILTALLALLALTVRRRRHPTHQVSVAGNRRRRLAGPAAAQPGHRRRRRGRPSAARTP